MTTIERSTWTTKVGLARMLAGGVIMDVVTADQAKIAEEAGAVAVMALERVPSDIRKYGGVARMSDPKLIKEIKAAVSIPVMAKCRIGHIAEAQILQALEVDFIDESEVLTPADEEHHVDKHQFDVPFVCGCRDLGEALRRIGEGAAMIRMTSLPGDVPGAGGDQCVMRVGVGAPMGEHKTCTGTSRLPGLVLGRGLRIVAAGTGLGLVAAYAGGRLIERQLFGVTAADLTTLVSVPLVLVVVAAVACWVPARRAARVDPAIALSAE